MLTYTYTARDIHSGQKIEADIEAESEKSAAKLLIARGLAPLNIVAKTAKPGHTFRNRTPTKQRIIFSRQLSTLINAGLPLLQSLTTVQKQTSNKNLKVIIGKIVSDIEAGLTLSASMAKFPDIFNNVYVSLVAAGEASGSLDVSLDRLATQQEKDAEFLSKIRGAMIYPAIVIVIMLAIVMFMTTTVLPQVANLYKSMPGAKLPFVTVWLMAFSHVLIHYWWVLLILLVTGIYFLHRTLRTDKGKYFIDRLRISMWPIAPLFMKLFMARFSRTMATLIGAGIPMIKTLETTADAIGNSLVADSIHKSIEKVKGGKSLSSALENDPYFLELVPDMISIGEQSGQLEGMMVRMADYYEKEVDNQIKSISTIVEPALMIVVGAMALLIVVAVLLPIYSLAGKNLGGG